MAKTRSTRTPDITPAGSSGRGAADPEHLVVGHIGRPHGIRGDVFVSPLTDHPAVVFSPGMQLRLSDSSGQDPEPGTLPLRIHVARPFRGGYLVRFEDVSSRSDAQALTNRYLVHPIRLLPELDEGELFYHELLGMMVVTADGELLGDVREVYELEPVHMLEVRSSGGVVLIPFTRRIVRAVDRSSRRIVVDPPEGLLDL